MKKTTNKELETIISGIKSMPDETKENLKNINKKKKEKKEVKVKRTLPTNRRTRRDEVVFIKHYDDDEPMVTLIKNQVQQLGISMNFLYEKMPKENAYNLYYGLATRNTMNWKTFCIWCDILGLEPEITVRDKF